MSRRSRTPRKSESLHDWQGERALLGAMLLNSDVIEEVEPLLSPADMSHPHHEAAYALIRELAENGRVGLEVFSGAAEERGIEGFGGMAYVCSLPMACSSLDEVPLLTRRLRGLAIRRDVERYGIGCVEAAHGDLDLGAVLDSVDGGAASLRRMSTTTAGFKPMARLAGETMTALEERMAEGTETPGISTGFRDLDRITGGLTRGHLVLLAARPAMGKTALALGISGNVARHTPTAVIELEMRDEALARRMLANAAGIHAEKLKTGRLDIDEVRRAQEGIDFLASLDLHIDDSPGATIGQIRSRVRRLKQANPALGLVVVDYLQIVKADQRPGENRERAVAEMSMALKHMAREFDVCMLVLSQLNRGLESREDKRPILSDLRDSGSLEQDADLVMFLYREEVYDEHTTRAGVAELAIAKQRDGRTGKVWLYWNGGHQRFSCTEDRWEPPAPREEKRGTVTPYRGRRGRGGEDE